MLSKAIVVLLLIGATVAFKPLQPLTKSENGEATEEELAYMLPGTAVPSKYEIVLTTHIESFNPEDNSTFDYEGDVSITLQVTEPTNTIVLHANKITINTAALDDIQLMESKSFNETTHKLELTFKEEIKEGKHVLKISFIGTHGDDMRGFYRSSYVNGNNQIRWLATTQFEAYDARRAFPCFDEPKYKALYDITIRVNKTFIETEKYSVLSNMPAVETSPKVDGEYNAYTFQVSEKKISSYLVAFIVSDFVSTETADFEETKKFATWGQGRFIKDKEADLSQEAGPAALTTMKKLTNVPFGYPKVDQIGIPDFSAGAMENWGLITYRERMIFYNEKKNPTTQRQSVVTTTTHELAHQWFGDLVTLWWWSDIWLNEGFATYFEYHATAEFEMAAEWNMIGQMVVNELQAGAFATDAQPNSRPLTKNVYRHGDIDANFDSVAYSKGGSVIRMWRYIMGDEKFYAALNSYLTAHQEGVATPEDLLKAFDDNVNNEELNDEVKFNPSEDFKNWHTEAGYPVVTVSRTKDNKIHLTQGRYLVSSPEDGKEPTTLWTIPITYTTAEKNDFDDTKTSMFLRGKETNTAIQSTSDWIIFNVQQTGFYRVNYDQAGWEGIIKLLTENHTVVHELNRAQILDDAFWLARSTYQNYTDYDTALRLSLYLTKESSFIPWVAALNGFSYLYGKLSTNKDVGPLLTAHITPLIKTQYERLTLNVNETTDSHTDKLLRIQIASWACKLNIKECVDDALQRGLDSDNTHPDVKSTVLCTNVRQGNASVWETVWNTYKASTDNAEQTTLLSVLGCSKDKDIINKYLAITLEEPGSIRKQDLNSAFNSICNGNPENVAWALEFLKNNYEKIASIYAGMDPLGSVMTGIATKLGSEEEKKTFTEINKNIQESSDPNVIRGQTSSKAAVDIINSNYNWLKEKQTSISSWLDTKYGEKPGGGGAATTSAAIIAIMMPILMALVANL